MFGFASDIPIARFSGARVSAVVVGRPSISFEFESDVSLTLYYYGATDNCEDWLYNAPLCGPKSVQSLVGTTVEVTFHSRVEASVSFSDGRVLKIVHDDPEMEISSFRVGHEVFNA